MLTLYLIIRLLVWLFKAAFCLVVGMLAFLIIGAYFAVIAVILLAVLYQVGRVLYWEWRARQVPRGARHLAG